MPDHRLIVVGAGALGAATAWQATRLGLEDVLVLDCGAPCSGTSPRGVGLVNLLVQHPGDIGLVKRSIDAFDTLDAVAGDRFTYHDTGGLLIAGPEHADQLAKLERLWRAQAVDVREAALSTVRDLPGCKGLTLEEDERVYVTEDDGWAVTTDAVNAMLDQAEAAGAEIRPHTPVDRVDDGQVHLEDEGTLKAGTVVVAAGVWTRELLAHAWPAPVQAYRAQAVALDHGQPTTPGPCVHDARLHTYWRPEGPGRLIIGDGTDLDPHDPTTEPRADQGLPAQLKQRLVERWPAAEDATLVRSWAGFEAGTPDARPLIGPVPGMEHTLVAAGGNGFGFMRSPALGEAIAHLATGHAPPIPVHAMRPDRFDPPPERFEMQEGFALSDPATR